MANRYRPEDSFADVDVNRQLAVLFRKEFLRMPGNSRLF